MVHFEELRNNRGEFRYTKLIIDKNIFFMFDKKGYDFLINSFNNNNLVMEEEYLAKKEGNEIKFFHIEFKRFLFKFDPSFKIHHKNGRKYDNRNANLQILNPDEYKLLNPTIKKSKFIDSMEIVRNKRGEFHYAKLKLNEYTFLFDKKGMDFLSIFDNGKLLIDDGYLAKEVSGISEYFHREFKQYISPFNTSLVVHHKNGRKYDNRNSNLQILSNSEHEILHHVKREIKYERKGELMRERYEKRREKAIDKYLERGIKMNERYQKRGERMRKKRYGF